MGNFLQILLRDNKGYSWESSLQDSFRNILQFTKQYSHRLKKHRHRITNCKPCGEKNR